MEGRNMIGPSNIHGYTQVTPERVATSIVFEDPHSWVIRCEGNQCPTEIRVSKRAYTPTDFSVLVKDPADASYNCTVFAEPQAMVCTACGPGGSRWQGWPWERFTYARLARSFGVRMLMDQLRFMAWAGHDETELWTLVSRDEADDLFERFDTGSFDQFH
jgi:hypothetical protein